MQLWRRESDAFNTGIKATPANEPDKLPVKYFIMDEISSNKQFSCDECHASIAKDARAPKEQQRTAAAPPCKAPKPPKVNELSDTGQTSGPAYY